MYRWGFLREDLQVGIGRKHLDLQLRGTLVQLRRSRVPFPLEPTTIRSCVLDRADLDRKGFSGTTKRFQRSFDGR
jgi:hypothetical protein